MTLKEGNRITNILTGGVFKVKKINKEWVLLQAEDGLSQVLTGKVGLKFMFVLEGPREGFLNMFPSIPDLGQEAGEAARG